MALATILTTASFADLLKVSDTSFTQVFQQQSSRTASGKAIYGQRGDSFYRAEVTSGPVPNAEAEAIMALINSRGGGMKRILLHNYKLPYPSSDPDGLILGATVPQLGAIITRIRIAMTGFPLGYVIPVGTYFSINIDDQYYLGQFCEPRTAVTGTFASAEIWPPLPPWVTGTPDIEMKKPPGKFVIVPNSAYPSISGALHTTIKFTAEQDL